MYWVCTVRQPITNLLVYCAMYMGSRGSCFTFVDSSVAPCPAMSINVVLLYWLPPTFTVMQEEGVLEWFESRSVTDAAISLNQEPRAGYGIKSSWITLQCIIKNCGIIYVQSAKRAFTPQDDCPPPMPLVSFYISTGPAVSAPQKYS